MSDSDMRTRIKICGMQTSEDVSAVNRYEGFVDYAGFILFCPASHRNLTLERAVQLKALLGSSIKSVAVTVSPSLEQVQEIEKAGFDYCQIHGRLNPSIPEGSSIPLLRAVNVKDTDPADMSQVTADGESATGEGVKPGAESVLDRILSNPRTAGIVLDAAEPGSGRTFDWKKAHGAAESAKSRGKIILLAGGLNPDNVSQAISTLHPFGVDVSSGVERRDGSCKDQELLVRFVESVRSADSHL